MVSFPFFKRENTDMVDHGFQHQYREGMQVSCGHFS